MPKVAEAELPTRTLIATERLTAGGIPLGCHVNQWTRMDVERPAHPNLTAWHTR